MWLLIKALEKRIIDNYEIRPVQFNRITEVELMKGIYRSTFRFSHYGLSCLDIDVNEYIERELTEFLERFEHEYKERLKG